MLLLMVHSLFCDKKVVKIDVGAFAAGAFAARVADAVAEVPMVARKSLRNVLSDNIRNREAEKLYISLGLKV